MNRRIERYEPSICVDNTERSSSPCMRLIVRRRASVKSLFAFMRASSLAGNVELIGSHSLKPVPTQSSLPIPLSHRIPYLNGVVPLGYLHSESQFCVLTPARRCATLTLSYNASQPQNRRVSPQHPPFQVIVEPLCDFPKVMFVTLSPLVISHRVQFLLPET